MAASAGPRRSGGSGAAAGAVSHPGLHLRPGQHHLAPLEEVGGGWPGSAAGRSEVVVQVAPRVERRKRLRPGIVATPSGVAQAGQAVLCAVVYLSCLHLTFPTHPRGLRSAGFVHVLRVVCPAGYWIFSGTKGHGLRRRKWETWRLQGPNTTCD
ncbi:unnamed protein product [Arctogadus glacialis]